MICQECHSRAATLHFTKIVNGEKTEFHICEHCAREKGELIPGTSNGFSIHNLLSGLLDFEPATLGTSTSKVKSSKCENCGLTYAQFGKIGRFGCSKCHQYFSERLEPLFRRVHGNIVHVGKVPKRTGGRIKYQREIESLKQQMQRYIEQEEFEQAAVIRDRIRNLEKKMAAQ